MKREDLGAEQSTVHDIMPAANDFHQFSGIVCLFNALPVLTDFIPAGFVEDFRRSIVNHLINSSALPCRNRKMGNHRCGVLRQRIHFEKAVR